MRTRSDRVTGGNVSLADLTRRILFVHHRSELGGAPTSLSLLIRNIDRDRFEPHVYCPSGAAAELFRESGATVHEGTVASFTHIWASTYRGRRWLLFVRELVRLPAHVVAFGRVLREGHFDLVHLNDSPPIPAAWLSRRAGKPVVWHLRSAPPSEGRDRRSRLLRRAFLRFGSVLVAINDDVARLWDVPAVVIPNAVDLERFRPGDSGAARAAAGLPLDRPVVSYFGFIYPSKGFREFVAAASLIAERGTAATYLVVGGGVRGAAFFRSPLGRVLELLGLAHDHEADARELVRRSRPGGVVPLSRVHARDGRALPRNGRPGRSFAGTRDRPAAARGRRERRCGRRHRHEDGRRNPRAGT